MNGKGLHCQTFAGGGQGQARLILAGGLTRSRAGCTRQQFAKPSIGLPCRHKAPPVPNRLFDRRKGARRQDRGCHHRAGRNLLQDCQIGPQCQYTGLHGKADYLYIGGKGRGDVTRGCVGIKIAVIHHGPAAQKGRNHSHCAQNFGIAAPGFQQKGATGRLMVHARDMAARQAFTDQCQADQHHPAAQCQYPQPGMQ